MTRFQFFRAFLAVVAVALAPISKLFGVTIRELYNVKKLTPIPEDHPLNKGMRRVEYVYRGFGIFWTGWKLEAYRIDMAGQWVGFDIGGDWHNKPFFYASYPGGEGKFRGGHMFDSAWRPGQLRSYPFHPGIATQEEFDAAKDECLGRLLALIDKHHQDMLTKHWDHLVPKRS